MVDVLEPGSRETTESTAQHVLERDERANQVQLAENHIEEGECTGEAGLQSDLQIVPTDSIERRPPGPDKPQ